MPKRGGGLCGLLLALALAACTGKPPVWPASGLIATPSDIHVPAFARWPYQPFSREAVVQIALREWRAFGQQIVYPDTELPFDNERLEGLWQRVGEYWWLALPMGADEQGLTGKHNQNGIVFPPEQDGRFAWSAAFVSYVMRMAGAGGRFPYSGTHADYINAARLNPGRLVAAERPEAYAPQRGDLICLWRGQKLSFEDLPAGRFASHCDIVVAIRPGLLEVIGGNVENSVALRRIPVASDGRLVGPDGRVVDPDHPWFVVLRVNYEAG
ncbi:MAG TPA: DUF2272 domain-containing protein [Stellaceae bacterium]|nr:DUF2272 domain-containing protein [Stellaceae bacterium]